MTFKELQDMVMLQTNNDIADLADYSTQIKQYLNEGYYKLHVRYDGTAPTVFMSADADEPEDLPPRSHGAIADYATYRLYLVGNSSKQNRSAAFLAQYEDIAKSIGKAAEGYSSVFTGLYTR
jgi:hypothetical protein